MFLIIVHLHGHPTTQLVFGSSRLHDNRHVVNFHSLIYLFKFCPLSFSQYICLHIHFYFANMQNRPHGLFCTSLSAFCPILYTLKEQGHDFFLFFFFLGGGGGGGGAEVNVCNSIIMILYMWWTSIIS